MKVKRVPKIFISYRQEDTAGYATLLEEKLEQHFGEDNVFLDVSDIPSGSHFERAITDQIKSCDILLAVIGKDWLASVKGKQAKEEEDFVRMEIATALGQYPHLVVVPVLVQKAQIPSAEDLPEDLKGLLKLNFFEFRAKQDSGRLIENLEKAYEQSNQIKTNIDSAAIDSRTHREIRDSPDDGVRNTRLSFYGGSAAALLSGTVVGVYYSYASANTEWWRPVFVTGFAFVIGVIMSGAINYGIGVLSRWRNDSPFSKLIGSTLGGTVGGILAAIVAALAFAVVAGDPVEPGPVAGAIIISNFVVAGGMLLPELRAGRDKRLYAVVILAFVSLLTWFVVSFLLKLYKGSIVEVLTGTTIIGGLIVGAMTGFLSGIQIGTALFVCGRDQKP